MDLHDPLISLYADFPDVPAVNGFSICYSSSLINQFHLQQYSFLSVRGSFYFYSVKTRGMTEELLHYIWKFGLFNQFELRTTAQESLQVIKVGEHNQDAGPDFFNAKIKFGETLWVGNVEVHIHSSDWKKHLHQHDKSYD